MAELRLIEDEPPAPSYSGLLNEYLRPSEKRQALVLDLFPGCGGLALGFEAAGFETMGFEMQPDYCATYARNLKGPCTMTVLNENSELPEAPVIIGGLPCQAF